MVTDPNSIQDERDDRGDNAETSHNDQRNKPSSTTAVRYGYMNYVGEFKHPPGMKFTYGEKVIIKTDRGIELGEQVPLVCSDCDQSVSREQVQRYIRNSGPEYYQSNSGRILRIATPDDLREASHLYADTTEKLGFCRAVAHRLNLPLKVVKCEHLLGGERVIFYFLAEGRVDFRALVKELAVEYQTRIEMRQVGVRDEARLLADYETCGRECCCKVFLKTLRPVSMKMAKMQKATLDPSKVSGRCGRLKCCLRYEHVSYEELDRQLPKLGTCVSTAHGEGVVVGRQILTQLLDIRTNSNTTFVVAIEDVLGNGDEAADHARPTTPKTAPTAPPAGQSEKRSPEPSEKPGPVKTVDTPTGKDQPPEGKAKTSESGTEPSQRRRKRRRRKPRSGRSKGSKGDGEQ